MNALHTHTQYSWLLKGQMTGASNTPPRAQRGTGLNRAARRGATLLGVLLVLILLAVAGCGASSTPRAAAPTLTLMPSPTPAPAPDPAMVAYVDAWRDAYNAVRAANQLAESCALIAITSGSVQDMLACQDPDEKMVAAASTLKAQLSATPPPARWQAQHAALLQAVQAMIDLHADALVWIAKQDVASFVGGRAQAHAMYQSFCAPIRQLNDGPPPLAPKLVVPDPGQCPTANG